MKTIYIKIILAVFILFQATSCSDFLDVKPESSFSAEGFYQSEDDAEAGVIGIYNAAQSVFSLNFSFWGVGRADNVTSELTGDEILLVENTLNSAMSSANWSSIYVMINRANNAIKKIPSIFDDHTSVNYLRLMGEAHALRALGYFYLVRVWGDVPFLIEPIVDFDGSMYLTKTDSETILDQVEADLEYAAENCKETLGGDNNRIMITKGGANAILTHVYMWRHNYQEALRTSNLVMNNSLYSLEENIAGWSSIFTQGYSEESIFEIGYSSDRTNGLRSLYAYQDWARFLPSDVFMAAWEPGDARMPFVYDVTDPMPTMIWKNFGPGFDDTSTDPSDNNIVLFRLADIMLLRAEALEQTNDTQGALELLNIIRERAGLAALDEATAISMYESVEKAILHERSMELCFEGHRWFDLVRTGYAVEVMGPINGLTASQINWPISNNAILTNPKIND